MENYRELVSQLREYSANDLFYKEYRDARSSPDRLQSFLARQSVDDIIRRHLICPELFPKDRSILPEYLFFSEERGRNIWVRRHDRFMPAFPHRHEYFEIVFVLSGECLHSIDGSETVLPEGSLCFVATGVEHSVEIRDDSIVLLYMIQRSTFDDIFFNLIRSRNILSDFFLDNLYTRPKVSHLTFLLDDRELIELLLSMYAEVVAEDEYTSRVLNNTMGLLFVKLVRKYGGSAVTYPSVARNGTALDIVSYINDRYKSVTLGETARRFGYSLAHCSRLIRSLTGRTFTQLLRDVRMRRAEALLASSAESVESIGLMVGYENAASFIKLFKQQHGMTPGAYRRAFRI